MLHSPDNHLTEKHLQRFYDYHSKKKAIEEQKIKKPLRRGVF